MLDEVDTLRGGCERISRRFIDMFQRTTWQSFQHSERTAADVAERVGVIRVIPGQLTAELVNRFVARYLAQDTPLDEVLDA